MEHLSSQTSVIDAAYLLVRQYPGGIAALAARLGKNPQVLAHKTNPNRRDFNLSVEEAVEIQAMAGDYRILFAMATDLGFRCVKLEADIDRGGVMENLSASVADMGNLMTSVSSSIADGLVTNPEMADIDNRLAQLQNHLVELRGHLAANNRELKEGRRPLGQILKQRFNDGGAV